MIQTFAPVLGQAQVADNTFVLSFHSPEISSRVQPGQFINIKTGAGTLLRRPFSVYRSVGETVEIIFNVIGRGSLALSKVRDGDRLDVIGPLGVPFSFSAGDFDEGVLVGGGLGVAPLPMLTQALLGQGKGIRTFIGARTAAMLVELHLQNITVATDDGTRGFHGNVVEALKDQFGQFRKSRPRIFACGPTRMLEGLAEFALKEDVPCEVSLEGPMACGFGICQGCPVEMTGGERRYALMCKDGPTFDVRKIRF
jgi:dihydroorotate dehydrogenase electron transfer subunit